MIYNYKIYYREVEMDDEDPFDSDAGKDELAYVIHSEINLQHKQACHGQRRA